MCAQLSALSPANKSANEDSYVNFREIFNKYLYHWPLFLIFLIVFFIGAFIYLKITKPKFEIKATLLMQDNKDKQSQEKSALQELDLANPPKVVENEMEILKSRNLVVKVVNDLNLWIDYQKKEDISTNNLYKKSPVKFELLRVQDDIGFKKFEILIKNKNTFLLKTSDGKYKQFDFKNIIQNNFGLWKLEPTEDIGNFIGSTIIVSISDPNAVADSYQKALDVTLVDKLASTVSLSMVDEVPNRGRDFVNRLIGFYNQANTFEKNSITQSTIDFIDKRLASLTGELNHAEGQVAGFRSSRGLTDIDKQSAVYLQNVQSNDSHLNEVNIQLSVIEAIENYINSPKTTNVPSTLGITDPGLSSMVEKLSQLQIERERMLATTPESNPVFDPINRQIRTTRSAIAENVNNIKSSLLAQKRQLQSFNNKFESSIRDVPVQEKEFIGLKRQQTLKENLYTYLLQKKEELSLSYASTLSDARLVDSAYIVPIKSTKRIALPFGVALALGLMIPAGIVYGRESIKNKVSTRKEIIKATGVPVLGELTYEKAKSPIVVHDKSRFAIGEEFRALRTKLHYIHGKRDKGRVTLFTSSISNEGKSFVSTNLAVALAATGRKTVILELDLRKPRVSAVFDLPSDHPGLTNYLTEKISEKEIIQHSIAYPNLDIMGSGKFHPDPSELLDQDRMEHLIDWLRLNYDDIIIDTPPVNIVTDAIILSRVCDVTLYIVRQGYTSKVLLSFIKELEAEQHFPKLNIVFNGIQKGRYGYGYGYGYEDYVADAELKKKNTNSVFKNFFKRF